MDSFIDSFSSLCKRLRIRLYQLSLEVSLFAFLPVERNGLTLRDDAAILSLVYPDSSVYSLVHFAFWSQ